MERLQSRHFKKRKVRRGVSSQIAIVLIVLIGLMGSPLNADAFIFQDRIATSKSLAHYAMGQVYDLMGLTNRAILEYEKAVQYDEASYLIHLRLGVDYARMNMLNQAVNHLLNVQVFNPEELQSHYLLALIYSNQKKYDKAADEYEYILKMFAESEPQNVEIYGYLGQLYYSQKKYDQAISQFEMILNLEPENPEVMYLLSSLYLEVEKDDNAIVLLKKALEIEPDHDGCLNTLGYIYAERGEKLDEALSLIEKAVKIEPDNGAYLDSLGWVYFKKKKYQKALETFVKASELLEDPVIYEHLGDVHHRINQFDEAIKYWEQSLELLPDQEEVVEKINNLKNIQVSR